MNWKLKLAGSALVLVVGLVAFYFQDRPGGQLRVVFCDVGQGDAVLVHSGEVQILIDGGPNDRVLGCLGEHMPFWDREIEVVVLTHPQADHMNGLVEVLRRFRVKNLVTGLVANDTDGFRKFREEVENEQKEGMRVEEVYAGESIKVKSGEGRGMMFEVVWPGRDWVAGHLAGSGLGFNGGSGGVLGYSTGEDLNSYSIGLKLEFGDFSALFTGDSDIGIESEILAAGGVGDVDVMKVPHHGSKTAMTARFLETAKPELAVISAGRNNRYGHPREETLQLLSAYGIEVARTDLSGEVVIESDGRGWRRVR